MAKPSKAMSRAGGAALVVAVPAALLAIYQLGAAAFVTEGQLDDKLGSWSQKNESEMLGRLSQQDAQLAKVQVQVAANARTGAETHLKVDSLVCTLVQNGRPVGPICVLPSGARRTLASGDP